MRWGKKGGRLGRRDGKSRYGSSHQQNPSLSLFRFPNKTTAAKTCQKCPSAVQETFHLPPPKRENSSPIIISCSQTIMGLLVMVRPQKTRQGTSSPPNKAMATKKGKKPSMDASPGVPFYPIDDESRARFRHQSLLQDYHELLKETEAKRMQLEKAKQIKLKLLAEVKFLRRKYKSFSKNPYGKSSYKLKKKPASVLLNIVHGSQPSTTVAPSEAYMKQNAQIWKEASVPSTSGGIDLNKVSLPNDDEMEEFQVNWEPLKIEKSKKHLVEGEALPNDMKLSICRDVGNGPSRAGKRKITWQDQVVLKV